MSFTQVERTTGKTGRPEFLIKYMPGGGVEGREKRARLVNGVGWASGYLLWCIHRNGISRCGGFVPTVHNRFVPTGCNASLELEPWFSSTMTRRRTRVGFHV